MREALSWVQEAGVLQVPVDLPVGNAEGATEGHGSGAAGEEAPAVFGGVPQADGEVPSRLCSEEDEEAEEAGEAMIGVVIEITRRCNMACPHCVRGEKQAFDMPDAVIDVVGRRLGEIEISTFTITGGEPFLKLDRLNRLCDSLEANGVTFEDLWIATNGVYLKPDRIKVIERLLAMATNQLGPAVEISNDQYHVGHLPAPFNDPELARALYPWVGYRGEMKSVIGEGRGEALTEGTRSVEIADDYIYITAKGDISLSCDLSFEHLDQCAVSTIFDRDAFLAIVRAVDVMADVADYGIDPEDDDAMSMEAALELRCEQIAALLNAGVRLNDSDSSWFFNNCDVDGLLI